MKIIANVSTCRILEHSKFFGSAQLLDSGQGSRVQHLGMPILGIGTPKRGLYMGEAHIIVIKGGY